jgi:hypothetical protein
MVTAVARDNGGATSFFLPSHIEVGGAHAGH